MFLGLLIYALIGFLVTFGIMRVSGRKKQSISANGSNPSVSVIVAVRNEEDNIPDLMDCLLSQSYENYEVIIVDDNSTDSTRAVAEKRIIGKNSVTIDGRSTTRVNVIPAKENLLNWGPKKNALHTGIEFSKGANLARRFRRRSPSLFAQNCHLRNTELKSRTVARLARANCVQSFLWVAASRAEIRESARRRPESHLRSGTSPRRWQHK
jgi:glycosyltransferase involved in cell wall biosynthesis